MYFTDEKDYIMRMIKEMVRILFSLIYGKKYVSVELEKENKYEVSGKNLKSFLDMIDSGQINEAENILLDNIDYANNDEVMAAALFYQYSCAKEGAQFIIVTHSPILLGIPDADIYCFDDGRIHLCEYEETESYRVTEMFINNRQMLLDKLLTD